MKTFWKLKLWTSDLTGNKNYLRCLRKWRSFYSRDCDIIYLDLGLWICIFNKHLSLSDLGGLWTTLQSLLWCVITVVIQAHRWPGAEICGESVLQRRERPESLGPSPPLWFLSCSQGNNPRESQHVKWKWDSKFFCETHTSPKLQPGTWLV